MTMPADRALRADAQSNHDRLLEVAAAAFLRDGDSASMRSIAKEAGVGAGTLYRRFPTREHLVEATYRSEITRLCAAAPDLLEAMPPLEALRAWMDRFAALTATKHGMGEALRGILTDDGEKMRTRFLLADAIDVLLAAGVTAGTMRADLRAYDLLLGIGGVTLIAGDADHTGVAGRLFDLVLDGVRFGAASN